MARGPLDDSRRGNLTYLNGEFPLYIACKYNHSKILKLLLNGTIRFLIIFRENKSFEDLSDQK
jgi:hypothetical protein